MSKQPEAIIDFEVYEDAVNFVGIANITPPDITYLSQTITGAGIGGNIEAVLIGMMEAMTCQMNFRSVTDAATKLAEPRKHNIDVRIAEQYWDTVDTAKEVQVDKFVMLVVPKTTSPGQIAPASASAASGQYAVYRYEAYKNGKELWCIDPFNYICRINGTDYMADVRKALGK